MLLVTIKLVGLLVLVNEIEGRCQLPVISNGHYWGWGYSGCRYLRPGGVIQDGELVKPNDQIFVACNPGYTAQLNTDRSDGMFIRCVISEAGYSWSPKPGRCVQLSGVSSRSAPQPTGTMYDLLNVTECEELDLRMNRLERAVFGGDLTKVNEELQAASSLPNLTKALISPSYFDGETYIRRSMAGVAIVRNQGQLAVDILKALVDRGANLNALGEYGDSLLGLAVEYGRKDVVKYLIDQGVDYEVRDRLGQTPLLKLFIEACRWPRDFANERRHHYPAETVKEAAFNRTMDILNLLLNKGARVDKMPAAAYTCGFGYMRGSCTVDGTYKLLKAVLDKAKGQASSDQAFQNYIDEKVYKCFNTDTAESALGLAARLRFDTLVWLLAERYNASTVGCVYGYPICSGYWETN